MNKKRRTGAAEEEEEERLLLSADLTGVQRSELVRSFNFLSLAHS